MPLTEEQRKYLSTGNQKGVDPENLPGKIEPNWFSKWMTKENTRLRQPTEIDIEDLKNKGLSALTTSSTPLEDLSNISTLAETPAKTTAAMATAPWREGGKVDLAKPQAYLSEGDQLKGYEEQKLPWGVKGTLETVLDPLNIIPFGGAELKLAAKALPKITESVVKGAVTVGKDITKAVSKEELRGNLFKLSSQLDLLRNKLDKTPEDLKEIYTIEVKRNDALNEYNSSEAIENSTSDILENTSFKKYSTTNLEEPEKSIDDSIKNFFSDPELEGKIEVTTDKYNAARREALNRGSDASNDIFAKTGDAELEREVFLAAFKGVTKESVVNKSIGTLWDEAAKKEYIKDALAFAGKELNFSKWSKVNLNKTLTTLFKQNTIPKKGSKVYADLSKFVEAKYGVTLDKFTKVVGKETTEFIDNVDKKFIEGTGKEVGKETTEINKIEELAKTILGKHLRKIEEAKNNVGRFPVEVSEVDTIYDDALDELYRLAGIEKSGIIERKLSEKQYNKEVKHLNVLIMKKLTKEIISGEVPKKGIPVDSRIKQFNMLDKEQKIMLAQLSKSFGSTLIKDLNILRTLQTSFDLSMPFRQGLMFGVAHPIKWAKNWKPMIQALFDEKYANDFEKLLLSDVEFSRAVDEGIIHIPVMRSGAEFDDRLDSYLVDWANDLWGIKNSRRAANAFVMKCQYDMWKSAKPGLDILTKADIPGSTLNHYKEYGKLIDATVGMSKLPENFLGLKIREYAPTINATMFSPKYVFSRLNLPTKLFSKSPAVAKEARREFIGLMSLGTGALGLYDLMGGDVSYDPRSSDYGKIVYGDTRLDIWGGYLQYVRFAAQMITGQKKTSGGDLVDIDRGELASRFWQSKESPFAALVFDLIKGEDFSGNKLEFTWDSIGTQAFNRLTPLFVQDMIESFSQNGSVKGLIALPSAFGMGIITYVDPVKKMKDEAASSFGKNSWDELLYADKLAILNDRPDIVAAEDEADIKYAQSIRGKTDAGAKWNTESKTITLRYNEAITNAVNKYRDTGNGQEFRKMVASAGEIRRSSYALMADNPDYGEYVARLSQPLTEKKMANMQPEDIARVTYNQMMYGDDMYTDYGEYDFSKAEEKKKTFIEKFGQSSYEYIEKVNEVNSEDMPKEYQILKKVQSLNKTYFSIPDKVWTAVNRPDLKQLAEYAAMYEASGRADKAKEIYLKVPDVLKIKIAIEQAKKSYDQVNPKLKQLRQLFY